MSLIVRGCKRDRSSHSNALNMSRVVKHRVDQRRGVLMAISRHSLQILQGSRGFVVGKVREFESGGRREIMWTKSSRGSRWIGKMATSRTSRAFIVLSGERFG
jgi:hypothetical protein